MPETCSSTRRMPAVNSVGEVSGGRAIQVYRRAGHPETGTSTVASAASRQANGSGATSTKLESRLHAATIFPYTCLCLGNPFRLMWQLNGREYCRDAPERS